MTASLLLVISGALALAPASAPEAAEADSLLARGWQRTEIPCGNPSLGRFYEVAHEESGASAEAYYLGSGLYLASHLPLPSGPLDCREISEPQFIEEIL